MILRPRFSYFLTDRKRDPLPHRIHPLLWRRHCSGHDFHNRANIFQHGATCLIYWSQAAGCHRFDDAETDAIPVGVDPSLLASFLIKTVTKAISARHWCSEVSTRPGLISSRWRPTVRLISSRTSQWDLEVWLQWQSLRVGGAQTWRFEMLFIFSLRMQDSLVRPKAR